MKNKHRIFISHTGLDAPIAEVIRDMITKVYGSDITTFLAISDILSGEQWKNEILSQLLDSDALISIITPESIHKPWIYIEWGHFWIQKKLFYILHTGDVNLKDDLINLMQDSQSTNLSNKSELSKFFASVSKQFNLDVATNEQINEFDILIKEAQEIKKRSNYGIYRSSLTPLPVNDDKKEHIARFFYSKNEIDVFVRITKTIRNDNKKLDIIMDLLNDINFLNQAELDGIYEISQSLGGTDKLFEIINQLIKFGNLDLKLLLKITENLAKKNSNVELRKIALMLIEIDVEESEYFKLVCSEMKNNAELIKIPVLLIEKNKVLSDSFLMLVDMFTNSIYVRNLAFIMIEKDLFDTEQFEFLFKKLLKLPNNQNHLTRILDAIKLKSEYFYEQYKNLLNNNE